MGDAACGAQRNVSTRKFSVLWNYFDDIGSNLATCNVCSKTLSYKGGSTFNLIRHLRVQHPTVSFRCGIGKKKIKIVKLRPVAKGIINATPIQPSLQEISIESNYVDPKNSKVEPDEVNVNEDVEASHLTSLITQSKVYDGCGGSSLGSMESQLLQMAREEHEVKMQILQLKKQYLETKISLLEKDHAE